MFDDVAARYDLTNDVLSLGQDRRWRRASIDAVGPRARGPRPRPRRRHRDVSRAVRRRRASTSCRATSRSACCGSASRRAPSCRSRRATRMRLPFADDTFDAVTISFGLRNVVDPDAGLRELRRVTRPGGRLVVCEFSHPTWAPFRDGLRRVPHERAAPRRPRASRRAPTPTSTSPSRSRPGPTSAASPDASRAPAGTTSPGGTSAAASSRCTAPPPESRLLAQAPPPRCLGTPHGRQGSSVHAGIEMSRSVSGEAVVHKHFSSGRT